MNNLEKIHSLLQDEIFEKTPADLVRNKTAILSSSHEEVGLESSPLNVKKVHSKVDTNKFFSINPVEASSQEFTRKMSQTETPMSGERKSGLDINKLSKRNSI